MKPTFRRYSLAVVACFLWCCSFIPGLVRAQNQPVAAEKCREAIDRARFLVDSIRTAQHIPGLSVSVALDGELVWSEGMGFANLDQQVPVTTETRFRIGSVSKVLTTAALARLVEEGKIDLDAPVTRYVPEYPAKRWPVTTRQLAGHQSGIRHYRSDHSDMFITQRYPSVIAGLDVFKADSLLFEPGTRFSYSTHAWTLVSAVIERAAGASFLSYMKRVVFDPLHLDSISPDVTDSLIVGRTTFYSFDDQGRPVVAPYVDCSWKWAGGGFLSNTRDLALFGAVHLDGRFFKPQTIRTLFTNQQTRDGEYTPVGVGWFVMQGDELEGRLYVGHSGGSVGGTAMLLMVPETELVVAVLANVSEAPSNQIALRVAETFLAKTPQ